LKKGFFLKVGVIIGFISINLLVCFAQDAVDNQTAKYVGVETCKGCHPAEYQDYSQRKFSKSWRVLKMREETDNPECVKCHVTGANRPNGFISEKETPELTGKQCEACHGPGGNHINDSTNVREREKMLVSNQDKNICIECHLCMTTHREIGF
jgi:hypothetical protein